MIKKEKAAAPGVTEPGAVAFCAAKTRSPIGGKLICRVRPVVLTHLCVYPNTTICSSHRRPAWRCPRSFHGRPGSRCPSVPRSPRQCRARSFPPSKMSRAFCCASWQILLLSMPDVVNRSHCARFRLRLTSGHDAGTHKQAGCAACRTHGTHPQSPCARLIRRQCLDSAG